MSKNKGGYHLLNAAQLNSDDDDEEDEEQNEEGEENLNIFATKNFPTSASKSTVSKKKNAATAMESVELRSRNSNNGNNNSKSYSDESSSGGNNNNNGIVLLERRIRKEDTLQKISLQFGISIAELKRANGFITDADLFAREIIKIPVRKYGYNHALIMAELDGGPNSDTKMSSDAAATAVSANPAASAAAILPITTTTGGISGISGSGSVSPTEPPTARAERLLQTVDENILKAQRQLEQRQLHQQQQGEILADDDHRLIDLRGRSSIIDNRRSNNNSVNGNRWSKRYVRNFVGCGLVILLLVGIPLIYIIYKLIDRS